MSNDDSNSKASFDMIPTKIRRTVDMRYIGLLSMIASLTFKQGYCSASNKYIIDNTFKMTDKKIGNWLDWLDENGFTVRYNQLRMVNNEFARTKRLIVLSDYAYKIYKSVNPNLHEPIECPEGFLIHADYLEAVKSKETGNKKTTKHRKAPSGVDETTNHDNEHVQSSNTDATNRTKSDAQELKQANRADIKQSSEDSSYISTFLAKQGIETKSNHDSFDVSRGIDDLVNSFNAKSEPEDEHVVSDSELSKLKNKWFIDASNLYSQRYSGNELKNKIDEYVLTRVRQMIVEY